MTSIWGREYRHLDESGSEGLNLAVDLSFTDNYDTAGSTTGYDILMAGSSVI